MKRMTKYYYSFEEFLNNKSNWTDVLGVSNTATQAAVSNTLLTDYLIPRYSEGIVKITSQETPDYKSLKSKMSAWLNSTYPYYNKLITLYNSEENNLLNKLETISTDNRAVTKSGGNTNTLNSGAQHSESRENDTPQNGGNFNDDEHTSSISISDYNAYTNEYTFVYNNEKSQHSGTITTSIDPSTIMERLTEIREKYVNLYSEWSNEFRVFIYNPATFEDRNECGCIYYEED